MIEIAVNRGSDRTLAFDWKDNAGAQVALNSVEIFQSDYGISSRLSIVETDLGNGEFNVVFEGTDPLPARAYPFWLKVFDMADQSHSIKVTIHVK